MADTNNLNFRGEIVAIASLGTSVAFVTKHEEDIPLRFIKSIWRNLNFPKPILNAAAAR